MRLGGPEGRSGAIRHGKLGVALHGAGQVARAQAAGWREKPHVPIAAVSSRRRASAERFVAELGLDCRVADRYKDVRIARQLRRRLPHA